MQLNIQLCDYIIDAINIGLIEKRFQNFTGRESITQLNDAVSFDVLTAN
jgi:hypothetical protein